MSGKLLNKAKIEGLLFIGIILIISMAVTVGRVQNPMKTNNLKLEWEQMFNQVKGNIALLPTYDNFPENATTWEDYAEKSVKDLLTYDDSWFYEPSTGIKGFRPYVKGADGWGGEDWTREIAELMSSIDVIWPLYRYLQLHPNITRQTELEGFIVDLPEYYWETYKQSTNRPYETKHDSWYFMENSVLKWGHLFLISNATELKEPYFGSLSSALKMAENFDYLFPQFVDVETKKRTQNFNINYCTAGLMAYSLITAYELTGNTTYLSEASNALTAMRSVTPPYNVMYEPQEVAAGVAAAAKMTQYYDKIDPKIDYAQLAIDLFYAEEQVLYYNNGNIDWQFGFNPAPSFWLPTDWRDGMHSPYANPKEIGSGGINAPAYKENIEAIMFWTEYLKYIYFKPSFRIIEPLKILNLNRIKNFYFFSPNIPDAYERDYGPVTLQYIPYEDIDYHASRGSYDSDPMKAGYNGKEIYGAGETLWNFLMFEALAEAEDNKSLIVNLNIFDRDLLSPENRAYIVWNPYDEIKGLNFTLKHLNAPYEVYINGTPIMSNDVVVQFQPGDTFEISLPARASAYVTLNNDTLPPPPPIIPTITSDTSTTTSITSATAITTTTPSTTKTIDTSASSSESSSESASIGGISIVIIVMVIFIKLTSRRKSNND